MFRNAWLSAGLLLATSVSLASGAAQTDGSSVLAAFEGGLARYVEIHRRAAGPLPPLVTTTDMDEVHRLMDMLRERIRSERANDLQGALLTPAMTLVLRDRIFATLTIDDIVEIAAELEEHTPAGMPVLEVNERLPQDAPLVMIAPQLLRRLPPLPRELRWVVLSKALVIWDYRVNLVVDLAPGLFDPRTYSKKKTLAATGIPCPRASRQSEC